MKRKSLTLVPALSLALLVGCGAGEPQNEAARDNASLALWPMKTTSDDAREQLTDGVRELDMGRQEVAYEHFKRAIATDPNFLMAEIYASFAAGAASSLEDAYKHLDRAVELSKSAGEVERLIVQITKKGFDNDDEGALADAQQLVKIDPNSARSWDLLAFAYDAANKPTDARSARDKAIELAPGYAGEYINQSASYAQTEPSDFVKAEEFARKAVELEPNDQAPYDFLGDALRAQGKLEEAAQAYTKCAELDPTRGDALQQRAHVQTFLGRYAEARADYDAAVALATGNFKPGLAVYRAFVYLHEGNPKAALAELDELDKKIDGWNVPDPTGSHQFLLGAAILPIVTHYRMVPEAEKAYARAKELTEIRLQQVKTPEFQRTQRAGMVMGDANLAYVKGDYATATAKVQEYMKLREADRSPTKFQGAHLLLGRMAMAQNRPADAVREFEQADPNSVLVDYYLAQALEGVRRTADAQKLYHKLANYYFNPVGIGIVRREALAKVKPGA